MNLNRCIHFIENQGRFRRIIDDEYESGFWDVLESKARKLIGGSIFFHSGQTEPSFYGGEILDCRVASSDDSLTYAGRIIFKFRFSPDYRGIRTARSGWGNEKKIVLNE